MENHVCTHSICCSVSPRVRSRNGLDEGVMLAMALFEHTYTDLFEIDAVGYTSWGFAVEAEFFRYVGAFRAPQSSAGEITGHADALYVSASTLKNEASMP